MSIPVGRLVLLGLSVLLTFAIIRRLQEPADDRGGSPGVDLPVPVEVAPVERGSIELLRTLSGTLEASEEIAVVPRVEGRVVRFTVDIGDVVEHGQVVAELDGDEVRQALARAEADLAVARANRVEAELSIEIVRRALERIRDLREGGVSSEAEKDVAQAELLEREAALQVARAVIARAEAAVESARLRVNYTRITTSWTEDDGPRSVAERFVDVGDTVTPSTRLLSIVDLAPIVAVVYVTERDYALLSRGQEAVLNTDAYPGDRFPARVRRIAPVFRAASRQARVELEVANEDLRLRPGMFVLAEVCLDRDDDAFIVPLEALADEGGRTGVFVVDAPGETVRFEEVETGIRAGERIQISGVDLGTPLPQVVTIGQELLTDGGRIRIAEDPPPSPTATRDPLEDREASSG